MAGVLDGIKVVSVEVHWAGPLVSAYMADWGADVIKVEPPAGEQFRGTTRIEGVSTSREVAGFQVNPSMQILNRNKRSLAINLKTEAGRDVLCKLVEKADVFLSNYQIISLKKLRLDYDTLCQINPKLVYAVVTGYGSKGPDKDEEAYHWVASWARPGIQHTVTKPGDYPARTPTGMGDINASVHAVAGIAAALFNRERTGKGQELECSLFHTALWSSLGEIQNALSGMQSRGRDEGESARPYAWQPLHAAYRTKDDRWLQFSLIQADRYWPAFCQALERPDLENDPRFNNVEKRRENHVELLNILDEIFASRTLDEWDKRCKEHHLIYSRVQTPEEVVKDPQALANNCFVDLDHPAGQMKVLASPTNFRQNPASVRMPAPELGQHTEEILLETGYSWEDIGSLKDEGVIP
ncbi:MAG: CoA transferase [Dehalococcoidales bacterium]|nr:CoA transferase [Dehalococcoidales bacterium]